MKKLLVTVATAAALTMSLTQVSAAEMPELAKKSGCTACHAIDKKVVGPAWIDVAKKYDDSNKEQLIKKVHTGGKGNWTKVTGGMPMPPYSPRVSDEDIKTLVEFVLSLDS